MEKNNNFQYPSFTPSIKVYKHKVFYFIGCHWIFFLWPVEKVILVTENALYKLNLTPRRLQQ
jgi:hypothetical protein